MEGFSQPVFINFREDQDSKYRVHSSRLTRFNCIWCRQVGISDRTLHNINIHNVQPVVYDPLMVMLETVEALWGDTDG